MMKPVWLPVVALLVAYVACNEEHDEESFDHHSHQSGINEVDHGLEELGRVAHVLQDPSITDEQLSALINVDRIPVQSALEDLSAVLKLMTIEQQLTMQSLRIMSIALHKLSVKVAQTQGLHEVAHHPHSSDETHEYSPEEHEVHKRSLLYRLRRSVPGRH